MHRVFRNLTNAIKIPLPVLKCALVWDLKFVRIMLVSFNGKIVGMAWRLRSVGLAPATSAASQLLRIQIKIAAYRGSGWPVLGFGKDGLGQHMLRSCVMLS